MLWEHEPQASVSTPRKATIQELTVVVHCMCQYKFSPYDAVIAHTACSKPLVTKCYYRTMITCDDSTV